MVGEMRGSNSVVESQPSKLLVAGSIPVSRSSLRAREVRARFGSASQMSGEGCLAVAPRSVGGRPMTGSADVAQLAERVLGKDEVSSSILDIGSRLLITTDTTEDR